tara:strand:+ start:114 stop:440 length:327 start_codon:yes stop_codon:yes gene_type:complete
VSAEWVYISTNTDGHKFWYEDENIRVRGDYVYVWFRTKYPEKSPYGDGSSQTYYKIYCDEYSFQILQGTFYKDFNWTNQSLFNDTPTRKQFIQPSSRQKSLADIVCEE